MNSIKASFPKWGFVKNFVLQFAFIVFSIFSLFKNEKNFVFNSNKLKCITCQLRPAL